MNDLMCYCCGKPIGAKFSIVCYKVPGGNERGFFMLPGHASHVLDKSNLVEVKVQVRK